MRVLQGKEEHVVIVREVCALIVGVLHPRPPGLADRAPLKRHCTVQKKKKKRMASWFLPTFLTSNVLYVNLVIFDTMSSLMAATNCVANGFSHDLFGLECHVCVMHEDPELHPGWYTS